MGASVTLQVLPPAVIVTPGQLQTNTNPHANYSLT